MPITLRESLLAAAGFGLGLMVLAPQDGPKIIAPPPLQARIAKLPNNLKISAAIAQLKRNLQPKGIRSLVELTPQVPYAKDLATLSTYQAMYHSVVKNHEDKGMITCFPPASRNGQYSNGTEIRIGYNIAQPGKVHIATFYFRPWADRKTVEIKRTEYTVYNEPNRLPVAFIPDKAGWGEMVMRSKTCGFEFYRVELDVLD